MATSRMQTLWVPHIGAALLITMIFLGTVVEAQSTSAETPLPESRTETINGYGQMTLTALEVETGEALRFNCDNAQRAKVLQGKLWADLSWDAQCGLRHVELHDGVPALRWGEQGLLVLARQGNQVFAVSGATEQQLWQQLEAMGLTGEDVSYRNTDGYPKSLDFFDLQAVSVYQLPLHVRNLVDKREERYLRSVLETPYRFWADFNMGVAYHEPYMGSEGQAPGHVQLFPVSYSIGLAVDNNQGVNLHVGAVAAPWWMANAFPQDMAGIDPYAIPGWNPLWAAGVRHLSAGASDAAMAEVARFDMEALEHIRQKAGDDLACLRLSIGRPGDELGIHAYSTEYLDYGPAAQNLFRRWLRDERGLSLAELGQRWHDDAEYFASWDDVRIPSHTEFFGRFGEGTLNLLKDWWWRPRGEDAQAQPEWTRMDFEPGEDWVQTDLVPSLEQLLLGSSDHAKKLRQGDDSAAWFRRSFDAESWLKKLGDGEAYLVIDTQINVRRPAQVWLNGRYLGRIKPRDQWVGPIAMQVTDLLEPGRNVLCLTIPSGVITGPVYLTSHMPRRYPDLGKHANARWVDLRDWQVYKLTHIWKRQADMIRPRASELPLMLAPGSSWSMASEMRSLKKHYGITSVQHTGGGSSYFPWWCGLGYVNGVYGSSEEGGTIHSPRRLSRELSWSLLNGEGHHNYYYDGVDYMRIEQKTGWFSDHRRLLELYGKSSWTRPNIVVLMSAKTELYHPRTNRPKGMDIGRGPLQATHYNHVYATRTEVIGGVVDDYPVMFDDGTAEMSEEMIDAIERYVRGGGTFVAVSNTGRNSLLEADTWPIQRLTGYRVLGPREDTTVQVLANNPLLKDLAGQSFESGGRAINWLGQNQAGEGVALEAAEAAADNCQTIAKWADGTTAIGMRRLGKGRVVTLGSEFWRNASDSAGTGISNNGSVQTRFLKDLFSGLNVPRQITCNNSDVWARRFITKNGTQQWMMLYNTNATMVDGIDFAFPWPHAVEQVRDMVSGQSVPATYKDGWVHIDDIEIEGNSTRVFGLDRRGFTAALTHWFDHKARFATPPTVEKQPLPQPRNTQRSVVIDEMRFRQIEPGSAENDTWLNATTSTPPWQTVGHGFWNEQGFSPLGLGVYRTEIDLPDAWDGRRIMMGFISFNTPVFLGDTTAYVNGQKVGDYHSRGWFNFHVFDVTDVLRAGSNDFAFRVQCDQGRGGYLGQVVLYPLRELADQKPLDNWQAVLDAHQTEPIELPSSKPVRCIRTKVDIPADWDGQWIMLAWEGEAGPVRENIGCIMVNGRSVLLDPRAHPFGNRFQINLHPWIKPGQTNTIELWSSTTADDLDSTGEINVHSVAIGVMADDSESN